MNPQREKVLVVWPEEQYVMLMHTKIPKRWAYLAEIFTFVEQNTSQKIEIMDCLEPRYSNGEVLTRVASGQYTCVIMVARFESTPAIVKLSKWIKEIDPSIKILVYGDLAGYAPNFFKQKTDIDAVLVCGDWEMGITQYIKYAFNEIPATEVYGIEMKIDGNWVKYKKGQYVPQNSWTFPNLKSAIFSRSLKSTYFDLTKDEVTLSVSRGCPFNCKFCSAVLTFGLTDRRKETDEVVEYIRNNKDKVKSFKFFSPTFTCNNEWVKDLCKKMIKSKNVVPWCATTRPDQLDDEEMVKLMAESGCYKIALGVETLDENSRKELRKHRDNHFQQVEKAINLLVKYNIKVTALMMLGIKGQTIENVLYTYKTLKNWGAKIRTAAYSPREMLKEWDPEGKVSLKNIVELDKMTYQNYKIKGISRSQFLKLIYDPDNFEETLNLNNL